MIYKYLQIVVALCFLLLMSCESAKLTVDFKKQKKQLDTLTVFSPFSSVVSASFREAYVDPILSHGNQKLIEKTSYDILSSRYTITKSILPEIDLILLDGIYEQIENSPKSLNRISSKSLLEGIDFNNNKYALLLIYNGQINPDFPPHSNFRTNSPLINMTTEPFVDFRIMVIDTEADEIVFFDRIFSQNYDPRVVDEVKLLTTDILMRL